ncbi:peptidoglycan DD-metalloendopeptidase family protein [Nocardia tengchongensis]|uniref:peptidoglycan DD-metalloendopeptidase family protein n=1 Tax=Nocardia tengchongensis TaxID=2055889 RepID=UPI0036A1B837
MTAVIALYRYRRAILITILLLMLVLAQCSKANDKNKSNCGQTPSVSVGGLSYPVDTSTPITSGYRTADRPDHRGVDWGVPVGTPVHALADGTVTAAQDTGVSGFGGWVVISHVIDGKAMSTVYGHMNPGGVLVTVGQQVKAGDVVANSGNSGQSTGPHLHFELWNGDRLARGTDTDPTPILDRIKNGQTGTTTASGQAGNQQAAAVTTAQDRNASTVIAVGQQLGAADEAIVIALAVGLVESELRNLASDAVPESRGYPNDGVEPGDHASIGIMQQQADMGYGTVAEIMDPAHAATEFYKRLLATSWQNKSVTEAAADVQKPRADLRGKYGAREAEARTRFSRLAGHAAIGGKGNCNPANGNSGTGTGNAIVAAARSQIGRPYVWGGGDTNGPTSGGFDCSGLTLYAVYTGTGTSLPHFTGDSTHPGQLQQGQAVTDINAAQPGDLVFFGSGSDATHVGIYTGTTGGVPQMVHAPTEGQNVTEAPVSAGGSLISIRRFAQSATTTTTTAPAPAAALPEGAR